MKEFEAMVRKLRIIRIQGRAYLGVIKGSGDDKFITDAVDCGRGFSKKDIARWLKCYNLNTTYEDIQLVGATGYTVQPFDEDDTLRATQCLIAMELAKKLALRQLENEYFEEAMKAEED